MRRLPLSSLLMTNRINTMNTWKLYLIYSIRFQNLDLGVDSDRIIPRLDLFVSFPYVTVS